MNIPMFMILMMMMILTILMILMIMMIYSDLVAEVALGWLGVGVKHKRVWDFHLDK